MAEGNDGSGNNQTNNQGTTGNTGDSTAGTTTNPADNKNTTTNQLDIKSLLKEIEEEDKAKKAKEEADKLAKDTVLKNSIKDILRSQKESEDKIKSEYESKIADLTKNMEEMQKKLGILDNTSQGSKVPPSGTTNPPTESQKNQMQIANEYYTNILKGWVAEGKYNTPKSNPPK